MNLIKPHEKEEFGVKEKEIWLYSDCLPPNNEIDHLVKNEVVWEVPVKIQSFSPVKIQSFSDDSDSEESLTFLGDILDQEDFLPYRKLLASLTPFQQDFCKNNDYTYTSLEFSGFIKNIAGFTTTSYENLCMYSNSKISLIYFVNDDYEGGDIFFEEQGVTISPKKNQLLIYSSNSVEYSVGEITSGEQYLFAVFLD